MKVIRRSNNGWEWGDRFDAGLGSCPIIIIVDAVSRAWYVLDRCKRRVSRGQFSEKGRVNPSPRCHGFCVTVMVELSLFDVSSYDSSLSWVCIFNVLRQRYYEKTSAHVCVYNVYTYVKYTIPTTHNSILGLNIARIFFSTPLQYAYIGESIHIYVCIQMIFIYDLSLPSPKRLQKLLCAHSNMGAWTRVYKFVEISDPVSDTCVTRGAPNPPPSHHPGLQCE